MKKENKSFYAIEISSKELEKARSRAKVGDLSLPDMFLILVSNQTIINEKLNKILNKLISGGK